MLDNKQFEDKAWEQMAGILDQEMPEKKRIAWWWFASGLFLLLFVGWSGSYFLSGSKLDSSSIKAEVRTVIDDQLVASVENEFEKVTIDIPKIDPATSEKVEPNQANQLALSDQIASIDRPFITPRNTRNVSASSPEIPVKATIEDQQKTTSVDIVALDRNVKKVPVGSTQKMSTDPENSLILPLVEQDVQGEVAFFELDKNIQNVEVQSVWTTDVDLYDDLENAIVVADMPYRISNLYALAEVNYLSDFNGMGTKLGLVSEIGASNSPWSFSTGLIYEYNNLRWSENLALRAEESDVSNSPALQDTFVIGSTQESEYKVSSASYISKLHYLNIPLQFHYRLNKLKLGLGIDNSFLVGSSYTNDLVKLAQFNEAVITNERSINQYQLSVSQSLQYRMTAHWSVGLKIDFDLTGIFAHVDIGTSNKLDHVGLQLMYRIK